MTIIIITIKHRITKHKPDIRHPALLNIWPDDILQCNPLSGRIPVPDIERPGYPSGYPASRISGASLIIYSIFPVTYLSSIQVLD
jgi:hypothetical protein